LTDLPYPSPRIGPIPDCRRRRLREAQVRLLAGPVCAALLGLCGVRAAASGPVEIELNKLEPREGGCQAWIVARNPGPATHDSLRLDVVLFDRDGVIARRLAVEAGPLPAGKTVAKAFVAQGLACETVGSLLLNDVLSCGGDSPCLDAVTVGARPPLSFTK
jgi:hypothetical protein